MDSPNNFDRRDRFFEALVCIWMVYSAVTTDLFSVDHFCKKILLVPHFLRCMVPFQDKYFKICWSVVLSFLRNLLELTNHWHHWNQYLNDTYSVFMGGAAG